MEAQPPQVVPNQAQLLQHGVVLPPRGSQGVPRVLSRGRSWVRGAVEEAQVLACLQAVQRITCMTQVVAGGVLWH